MNVKRLIVLFLVLFLSATAFVIVAPKDPVAAHDAALNDVVDRASSAVYQVKARFRIRKNGESKPVKEQEESGTAFGVTDSGLLLTAYHVAQAPVFQVRSPFGTFELAPTLALPATWNYADGDVAEATYTVVAKNGAAHTAEIVAISPKRDLALLSIAKSAPGNKFPFVRFETNPLRHDSVVVIGTPFEFAFTVAQGIISNPARVIGDRILVQTDAMVHPGNSGSPLILLKNRRVAGVIVENYSPHNAPFGIGIAFAVPASEAAQFVADTLRKLNEATQKNAPRP